MNDVCFSSFGSWKSPISAAMAAAAAVRPGEIRIGRDFVFWSESRPDEKGRTVIICKGTNGTPFDLTPPDFNVRSRVHEYGGGSFIDVENSIFFVNFSNQRIYRQQIETAPVPITPNNSLRYADFAYDKIRNRLVCVCEDHSNKDNVINSLVAIELGNDYRQIVIAAGCDFYSSPRIDPDGSRIAWIQWDHANMPWDDTFLCCGNFSDDGLIADITEIAGSKHESIFQPHWSPSGILYFVSDRNNWWNIYRYNKNKVEPVIEMEAEFAAPQWVFAMSTYDFINADTIAACYNERGIWKLMVIDITKKKTKQIKLDFTKFANIKVNDQKLFFSAASPTTSETFFKYDLQNQTLTPLKSEIVASIDPDFISQPDNLEFPTEDGKKSYGFFYPPKNRDFKAPASELPPLIVKSHGGPTASSAPVFQAEIQYWTSRGFAFIDVNYRGSTGYGRAYRRELEENWGIVDVADCCSAADYLVRQKLVDPKRLIIAGGSAGGYTTLCALTFRKIFKAGSSRYGVSDVAALAADTHKFESRYLDRLIGPYPEEKNLYRERSPINFTDRLSVPVIFFQGLQDRVVPPEQTELMVKALESKNIPVAYVAFENEQHGFRIKENIARTLEAELYFYSRILGFELADEIEAVEIKNF